MKRPCFFLLFLWTMALLFFEPLSAQEVLTSGEPVTANLSPGTFTNYAIDVPAGATKLTVTLSGGIGDLDLFVKFGSALSGSTYGQIYDGADFVSTGPDSNERIEVSTSSTPPLRDGRWYIAPVNVSVIPLPITYTLTATVEGGGGGGGGTEPSTVPPSVLKLSINDPYQVPWGYLRLSYQTSGFKEGERADLYIAVLFEDGSVYVLGSTPSNPVAPLLSNIALANGDFQIVAGKLPTDLFPYTFTLYGILVKAGANLFDPANWLGNIASLTFFTGNLGGEQRRVLAEHGNPYSMEIRFDRQKQERIETWRYGKGHLGQVFVFYNGLMMSTDGEGESASYSKGPQTPVLYGPDRFSPATTLKEIRALMGEPSRIVDLGSPGLQSWMFENAHMSVTVQDGSVTRIGGQ